MTLRIYDINIDETRDATQDDIDTLMAVNNAYGRLRTAVADVHTEVLAAVKDIKNKGRVADLAALQTQTETNDAAPTEG